MYHVFICHAWKYNSHYETVLGWLRQSGLQISNYSIPREDPFGRRSISQLKQDIAAQIRPASCVIIISGMYAAHSNWIDYEISEAVRMGKYIIGIRPWGQERVPTIIQQNADIMVGWNASSLISAIRNSNC